MRPDELLRRLNTELRILKESGLEAIDLGLIKERMDSAQGYLATDPSLQQSIARFSWSTTSARSLVGLLTRVADALADLVNDEYRGGFAHGSGYEQDDRRHRRYRVEVRDEGAGNLLFFSR